MGSINCFLPVLLSLSLLLLQVTSVQSSDPPAIPSLPNYFSGYTETLLSVDGSTVVVNASRSFYDVDMNLARIDVAGELFNSTGTVSFIQDISLGVYYTVYRQHNQCKVSSLIPSTDLRMGQDGRFYLRNVSDLLFLTGMNYTYAGNMSAHGLLLDNWKFTGNFSHYSYDYTDATVQWSITRAGQAVASTTSVTTSPALWRFSIEGTATSSLSDDNSTFHISSVSRYFELSFEEPSVEVFDISVCVDPEDAVFLTLAVPGVQSGLDPDQFRSSVRRAVSNYVGLYPAQVGNVQITNKNTTFLLVSLQLSNLTSLANITSRTSAREAYNTILENTIDGQAPFQIELSSGTTVTPHIFNPDKSQDCSNATTTIYVTPSEAPPSSDTPPPPSVIIITTTITITPTTSCTPLPTQVPTTPPTCPPGTRGGLSQSHVVGIAFGTLITGGFVSCVSLVVCFMCYQKTRTRKWSPTNVGYQKTPDTMAERDYFQ